MKPLSSSIDAERANLFVGRQQECGWLAEWLDSPHSRTQIAAITGIGGVGKSTLLMHLLHLAKSKGAAGVWVDGRTCYRTPNGFLESLPRAFQHWRQSVGQTGQPLVLAIDNYEDVQVLESWLREVFLPELPEFGVLVATASRTNLMSQWRLDPGWRQRVTVWTLQSFTPEEVEDFLCRQNWPAEDIEEARRLSLGHPLSLAVVAEGRRRAGLDSGQTLARLRDTLSAGLLREVTDPELQPLVDALTIMMEANLDLLQRVLQRPIAPEKYRALTSLSFVKPTTFGVGLHDIATQHLFEEFRRRDPNSFERLRRQAVAVLLNEWDAALPAQQGRVAQHLLWLCRDAFRAATQYADLSYNAEDLRVTEYRSQDYPFVRQFIEDWGRQSFPISPDDSLVLFDKIRAEFPESIRVTRRQDGRPLAVFVALTLHDQTLALLSQYHPEFVARLMDLELGINACPMERANASLNVLTGIDKRQAAYAPDQILGVLARDQFSFQAGILGLLLLTNPAIKQFLGAIGYHRVPFPVSPNADLEEDLYVLDLRGQHFGQWIRQILFGHTTPSPTSAVTAEDVRYFLAHWADDRALAESRLAAMLCRDWRELRREVEQLVTDAANPLTSRDQAVLRIAFLDRLGSVWQAAQSLHVSRATFYRYQDQAVARLLAALTS